MVSKEEILELYKVDSLSDINDEELIIFALNGKLGNDTFWTACRPWMFQSEHDLANHIRKAIKLGKEFRSSFTWGEGKGKDVIKVWFE